MPIPFNNDAETRKRLTNKEVAKAATITGVIGLGLLTVGLGAVVLLGLLGTMSEEGRPAVAIGVECILLMLPSATILGLGVVCLNFSAVCAYSLLIGKPVYSAPRPPHASAPRAEPGAAPDRCTSVVCSTDRVVRGR